MTPPFDSVHIHYFTGTNNTAKVASLIKEKFEAKNISCTIGTTLPHEIPKNSLIALGYPIHAFNPPKPFVESIKKLPSASNNVFIFKVSGEPLKINKASSKQVIKILQNKGYTVVREDHFLMPYNIWFKYSDQLANHMNYYVNPQSELVVNKLLAGETNLPIKMPLRAHIFSFIFKIQWPAAPINGKLYTVDQKKCTLCGICERGCPVDNIKIENGKVNFYNKCAMCMYCSMYCPEDAINIGILRWWKVNGPYNYKKLALNKELPIPFITKDTKGFKKIFINHYENLNQELAKNRSNTNVDTQK
ncbi:MAG: EFR1 family ferrodoxin [Sphaerochaetaceae bacterium]